MTTSQMTEEEFQAHLESEPGYQEKSSEGDYNHIPIGYLEPDLRATFNGDISITIKKQKLKHGILTLIIRLDVFHPVKQKYLSYDGIASTVIQLITPGKYEGSTISKTIEDIKPEVAACYSEAIKNAAKKIGKRFGSDINRKIAPGNGHEKKAEKNVVEDRIQHLIDDCTTAEEIRLLYSQIPNDAKSQSAYTKKLKELLKQSKPKK